MPRKFFRRLTPNRQQIVSQPLLRPVAQFLGDPNIWHLNRRSVSGGVALGLFLAFIPLPGQMLMAAAGAIAMRVNIALAVATVWVTNPVTIPPLLWIAYQVGALLTGASLDPPTGEQGVMSIGYAMSQLPAIWLPLGTGLLTLSFISSLLGFAVIRLLWRIHLTRHKRRRRAQRLRRREAPPRERPSRRGNP
jgi:hypothetical protein